MLTKELAQTFLISTIVNAFADKDDSRSWPQKVARAAIVSVPETIVLNTDKIVDKVAERFPSLGLKEAERPKNAMDLAEKVEKEVSITKHRVVAYYSHSEDHWKNPPGAPTES